MNAIDLLKEDHRVVDTLFKRVEDTPPSKHTPIFKKIKNELDAHAHIEEKVFYPVLKSKGKKDLVDITLEGIEEHAQIKKFLKEIARSTSTDKREAKLKVLMEDTRHHVKEEEKEMFPMVEDQFSSEELEKLGERMEAEKVKFQKAKKIPARREPPKGTVATVIDKAKKMVAAIAGGGTAPAKKGVGSATAKKSAAKKAPSASKKAASSRSPSSKSAKKGGSAKGGSTATRKKAAAK